MNSQLLQGIAAGAAGTTALNTATYVDMVLRARPASTTPQQTVRRTEDLTNVPLSAEGPDSESADNRRTALGALMGIGVGLGTGAVYAWLRSRVRIPVPLGGVLAAAVANIGSTAPMTVLGVTNPRSWSTESWLSDIVPHLCYGLTTTAAYERMHRSRSEY